jgi:glycosyltransferase involved in cell wall biosynthesis
VLREDVPAFLGLADVLLSPRSHGGNLPLKALEYLDSGKPIVASDIPTHRLLFRDGTALLASPTPQGFGEAIVRVLTDDALADRLKAAGTEYAEHHLAWARFVEQVEEIIGRAEQGWSGRGRLPDAVALSAEKQQQRAEE